MLYKTTNKLFKGTYQYKIVLVCAGAGVFRSGDMTSAAEALSKIDLSKIGSYHKYSNNIRTQDDLDYATALQKKISKIVDYEIRVENPWITLYSNNSKDIHDLAKIDSNHVKYICQPPTNTALVEGTIILPKVPFEFKVTVGKTTQNYSAFVDWANTNSKVKLTKGCARDLNRDRSWGGAYFYISGDNMLLVAKMHLGGSINKVERIIKA